MNIECYSRVLPKKESNNAIENLKTSPPVKTVLRKFLFSITFFGKIKLNIAPGLGGAVKELENPWKRKITISQQRTTMKLNAIATYPVAWIFDMDSPSVKLTELILILFFCQYMGQSVSSSKSPSIGG